MDFLTNKQNYRLWIFEYGIVSILMVLEYFQSTEQYEECQKIIDAIKEQNEKCKLELPTILTQEVLSDIISEWTNIFKKVYSEDFVIRSSVFYASIILDEIHSQSPQPERDSGFTL